MFILMYVLIVMAAGTAISLWNYRWRLKFIKSNILDLWGKEVPNKLTDEDMANISSYFTNNKKDGTPIIDDITWNDLDMKGLFQRMNNTQSTAGEEVLYSILRTPLYDESKLQERNKIISYFESHDDIRTKMQYILAKFGKKRELCVSNFFYNDEKPNTKKLILYRILSIMPLVLLALIFLVSKALIIVLVLSIGLNMYIHYTLQKKNGYKFQSFTYITSMILCAYKLSKFKIDETSNYLNKIKPSINNVKKIRHKIFNLAGAAAVNDALILTEYIGILFLTEVINFENMKYLLIKNREDFQKIYEFVGTLDSLIAIASYRKSLEYYSNPVLTKAHGENHFTIIDMYHPLIKNPVVNSCDIRRSMLITGSNASGKSTFLKTLAINALMAQTIYTCTARKYDSSFFLIYSSMALRDNIFNNESYFIVEIKSLKRIIDSLNDEMPCLCFVDEILRGTNTVERISSSSEVLNYFGNSNCICVAATHDIELTRILESVFDNYHFQEDIVDNQIKFDYKLYSGRAETRNAIKLLKFLGYKESIVKRAEERAEDFVKTGSWNKITD